ncbi:hypothetical protein BLOT_010319 [Blomia tropicalis]|nr:hypothetical protein BLOT_010319 [Blomia tropicalis]
MGLIRGLFVFGLGLYAGIYVSQNYKIPAVDKPEDIIAKFRSSQSHIVKICAHALLYTLIPLMK